MLRFLPCLYAFLSCIGFCLIFQIKKPLFILLSCTLGAISWWIYLVTEPLNSEAGRYLIATVVVSALAELLARVLKAPATIFLVIGIIPLVPGGGLYYTMDALLNGNYALFTQKGLQTLFCAGAIAVGASMVTSLVRMFTWKRSYHMK
jgi:uncharacterized membrane protein YjjB (DUF3815 family)